MKKFKDYINENVKNIKNAQGNNEISELIAFNSIPLSTTMMDRLGYSYEDEAYHITAVQYLEGLKKIQGSKKQISAFTVGGNELLRLPSNPDVLIKIEGNVVIGSESDMWTLIDKGGRRWISLRDSKDNIGTSYGDKLSFFITGIKTKIVKSLGYTDNKIPSTFDYVSWKSFINNMTKEDRSKLYKSYIEEVEKYLEKGGYKLLNSHLKNNITFSYNELVMNKIKIIGAYSIDNTDKKKDIEENKIKYLGIISKTDIANLGR